MGKISLEYANIIKVIPAIEALDKNIPEFAKNMPIEILSPISYEYEGDDYTIFHFYSIIITRDIIYVIQPYMYHGGCAVNIRNLWLQFLWMKQYSPQDLLNI